MVKPFFDAPLPYRFAHRGATRGGLFDENTWPAFEEALAQGATHIETDAHATRDGVAVLFHDDDLVRVGATPLSSGRKLIREYDLAELQAMQLAGGGQIPTLSSTLEKFSKVRFNIDVKTKEAIAPVAEAINRANAHDRVLITSFSDSRRLATLRLLSATGIATSPGSGTLLRAWIAYWLAKPFGKKTVRMALGRIFEGVDSLQVPERHGVIHFSHPGFVSAVLDCGLLIQFWVVNNESDAKRLIALGASGLVSDDLPALHL